MPRWAKMVGWAMMIWTIAIAIAAAVVAIAGGCGDVAPSDFHICELNRGSTISGLVMLWFIVALPMTVVWVLARARRRRCRICGDELGHGERRVCHRCGVRLIESAAR